jgi:UDP-N-acetyl-2-amino-2-deoxyglucuronate dehydrogenase
MTKTLRVGIVGLGAVARVHLDAYRDLPGVEVVGVADTNKAQLVFARQQLGLSAYSSVDEMLATGDLDIACVLTPPATHEEVTTLCAGAHVNVLCEKPLALSVESCERMIEACRVGGVRLCYGASYRYLPTLVVAREIIQRGDIGDVLVLREYAVGGAGVASRQTLSFAHYPEGGPGGSGMGLCDHGIHLIDAFAWLMDTHVTRVVGRGNISGAPQHPEYAHLEYANGAVGQLLYEDGTYSTDMPHEGIFSWGGGWSMGASGKDDPTPGVWHPHPGCVCVHGTRGALRIFYYANSLFWISDSGVRQVRVPDNPMPGNFRLQLAAFADAIRAGAAAPVPGEAGLDACRTLLGIYAGTGVPLGSRLRPLTPSVDGRSNTTYTRSAN